MTVLARAASWRKLLVLGALYFAQGLPFGFFTQALPVVLRERGSSLGDIGLTSLLALPWAFKFLWAPVVDRCHVARWGRRKTWIVPLQAASVLTLLVVGGFGLEPLTVLLVAVFWLNLLAATQDIATDGLAVDVLSPGERGFGNGLQVAGYRAGMIIGGGALLIAFDALGPRNTFWVMAALIALASWPLLMVAERAPTGGAPSQKEAAASSFLRRPGAVALLALLVAYKSGDAFATSMLRPFLSDAGLSLSEVGWLLGTAGFVAGLVGALVGGGLVNRLGRKRALLTFGALQALSVCGYVYLAARGAPHALELYLLCSFEHFAGGMATAALFTCMMDWSRPESGATDYTVQASAVVIATGAAASIAGFSAQALGYQGHFLLAAGLCVASLWLVQRFFPEPGTVGAPKTGASGAVSCA